jgi:hypothetical protein
VLLLLLWLLQGMELPLWAWWCAAAWRAAGPGPAAASLLLLLLLLLLALAVRSASAVRDFGQVLDVQQL